VARFAKQVEGSLVLRAHAWPNARKRRFVKVHPTLLKADGPLPVAIETDVESYLGGRRAALDREIEEVGKLADQDKRHDTVPRAEQFARILLLCAQRWGLKLQADPFYSLPMENR
jgi:hypothetical protein